MARSTKRLLALLLALMLCVSLLPATALAEEAGTIALVEETEEPIEDAAPEPEDPEALPPADEANAVTSGQCGDDLTWHFDTETGVLTVTGTGAMWDWTDGGTPWNSIRSSITAAELPDGLTSIGNYAFWECRSLTSITIPASVTAIGEYAFYGAGLTELTIPGSVETIGKWAFAQNRSLERVTLQEGISSIGIWAFCYCSHLREIRIPASTAALGGNALRSDPALTDVYYGGTRSQWAQIAPDYLDRFQVTVHCSDGDVETLDRAFCGDDLTWTLENGVLTVSGTGDMWDFYEKVWGLGMSIGGESTAPWSTCLNEITGVVIEPGVTSVGACAFSGCRNLSSISMPDGLTRIGNGAFQGCTSLQSVTIPQGVEVLGPAAFYYCQKLSQVTLPSGLREIGGEVSGGAFQWCTSLREITIPDSVTVIGNRAFYGCSSLETVCLPTALTSIGWDGFFDCSGLHTIIFQGGAPSIRTDAFSGVTATAYYPAEDETWTDDVRQSYGGTLTWVALIASGQCGDDLTWTLSDDGVLTISGTGKMYDFSATGSPWFSCRDQIVTAVIENGATSIGSNAFSICSNLTAVEIPASVTSVGEQAFSNCSSLTDVVIPDGVTQINKGTFFYCRALTSMTIPAGVTVIGQSAFDGCSGLTGITIPAGVTSIGDYAFRACGKLTSIKLPDGLTGIGRVFELCSSLTSVEIPASVTSIGDYAFGNCSSLASIVFPDGLTRIGSDAFTGCSSLTSVAIPASVTSIGSSAFGNCSRLTEIVVAENNPNYYSVEGILYLKAGNTIALQQCPNGKTGSVVVPDDVANINAYAFMGCRKLTSITLPESLTDIGWLGFGYCTGLTELVIPAGVTNVSSYAFQSCSSLTKFTFQGKAPTFGTGVFSGVTATAYYPADDESWTEEVRQNYNGSITWVSYTACGACGDELNWTLDTNGTLTITGTGAMWDFGYGKAPWYVHRTDITSVVLPDGLTGIGEGAFGGCSSLTSIVIPEGVTEIKLDTFSDCTSLESASLPAGLISIGERAFSDCPKLTNIELPAGSSEIGDWAFAFCSGLESITIPAGVTSIGSCAFYLANLMEIRFEGSAPTFGSEVFFHFAATAYYPADDESWTEEVRQNYGGDLTWVPYTGEPMINVFGDVAEGKYYYEPVLWAYYHDPQITGGISDTEFGPSKTCTREQIVTFLWKAMGAPEPKATVNPFEDVKSTKYYYKAVLWAVESGITGGMDATHFGVGKPCTREQAMTFLWKAMGAPEPETTVNPFEDVKSTKYYYKPVLWAVENGITGGVDATHFGVGKPCTRGQIVTFLYKALAD